ncbi:MAG: PD-(D/E)XK nuclease family protein [Vicinamibacterales bacterium]
MLRHAEAGRAVLVVGASRAAADELVARVAIRRGGLVGVSRAGVGELATRLALPLLAARGLLPTPALGDEAVAARATFESAASGELKYFEPVAGMPGFPRALGRTLAEIRMAGLGPEALGGDEAVTDLARLLDRVNAERQRAGAVDYAALLATAAEAAGRPGSSIRDAHVLLLDVPASSAAEARFVEALAAGAQSLLATIPDGDARTRQGLGSMAAAAAGQPAPAGRAKPAARRKKAGQEAGATGTAESALHHLQRFLFSPEAPPAGTEDDSVVIFSAPGEGREAVEVARRILEEAARGVPFDEMAVLLRAPQTYLSLLEHALDRAGVPAWYHRGTRRPDPAGRALLALIACAEEGLSARRFAEYVSLGQVPTGAAGAIGCGQVPAGADGPGQVRAGAGTPGGGSRESGVGSWQPALDESVDAIVPARDRVDDSQPEEERRAQSARGETPRDVAGTLRAPWRWEDLIVEAAVIGGIDRWRRRLAGLEQDYAARLREVESEDPHSSRTRALRRDTGQLRALQAFALPVLGEMAAWPGEQRWGDWLHALTTLAPTVLAQPARVLRVLQELAPLAAIGPVTLREVREVLAPRLSTLTHEPPRRRFGRVFVGTPHAARGRAFQVVFVPGLAERMFPQRIREDALLLDHRREELGAALARQPERAADERLQLMLAAGAARERLYVSYPRLELNESRPRVPSFYVLDIVRAVEGVIPSASRVAERAYREGGARLAWPAPDEASRAIDAFEHDLSTIGALLASRDPLAVRGRARYLYELSPELQRSLTARWIRWHRRQWDTADGLVRSVPGTTAPALARHRLGARPYSLTALQRFAACPYQFMLAAIYRLAPLEAPAPLQKLDPLTRGDLFHRIQTHALRKLQSMHLLPLSPETLPRAQKLLEWSMTEVEKAAYDDLAPAIERVWRDEMAAMGRDLKIWLENLAVEGAEWTPERFELAFGLEDRGDRDPASSPDPARVDGRFLLRGSIDMVERHRQTGMLRVTDHKTGKNRTETGTTIVSGGRVLQPVVYGLALEAMSPENRVYSGRLSFCTAAGGFTHHEIPLLDVARKTALQVLEITDRGIEQGLLAARPDREACAWCDFTAVCGRDEERRTRRKDPSRFADLDALRDLP